MSRNTAYLSIVASLLLIIIAGLLYQLLEQQKEFSAIVDRIGEQHLNEISAVSEMAKQRESTQTELPPLLSDKQQQQLVDSIRTSLTTDPNFSLVTIRIESPSGKPLANYTVKVIPTDKSTRNTLAENVSDESGTAISRLLPYGRYKVELTEPSGWSDTSYITVEVGEAFEKLFVAPDPDLVETLTITSKLDRESFREIRFGEHMRKSGSGYGKFDQPEPDEEVGEYLGFPTIDNGVALVGMEMTLQSRASIEQPDGSKHIWSWKPLKQGYAFLLLSDGTVAKVSHKSGRIVTPKKHPEYFTEVINSKNASSNNKRSIEYQKIQLDSGPENQLQLYVPIGEITFTATRFLGKPTELVRELIIVDDDREKADELWLAVHLANDSEWGPRLFSQADWEIDVKGYPTKLASRIVEIREGEEKTLGISLLAQPSEGQVAE